MMNNYRRENMKFLFCVLVGCSNKKEFPDNIDYIVLQETNGDKIIVGC